MSGRAAVDYAAQMAERRRLAAATQSGVDTATVAGTGPAAEAVPSERPNGRNADTPIARVAATGAPSAVASDSRMSPAPAAEEAVATGPKKPDRQGIDLRPLDRELVYKFDLFCLQNRVKTGKKKGLSLYARAGFELLDRLIADDPETAKSLLRSIGEVKR